MENQKSDADDSAPDGEASNATPDAEDFRNLLLEAEIRSRAYAKWEAAGCPFSMSDAERHAFWYAAEKEILERKALEAERKK